MSRTGTARKYGKPSKKSKAERLFAELPQTPVRKPGVAAIDDDPVGCITDRLSSILIDEEPTERRRSPRKTIQRVPSLDEVPEPVGKSEDEGEAKIEQTAEIPAAVQDEPTKENRVETADQSSIVEALGEGTLRVLSWDEVCPAGDKIDKIAEASYAEVYRVTNDRGTSIIKVIRLNSPIKTQTKAQVRARLVDELPHCENDIRGELQISEWLADIPGFVVYKERYIVQGKTSKELLETHQGFQKRLKRQDPGRAQFYPSPSRYLDDTRFLVVELGDAGVALEDWKLKSESHLWDIFFLEAIALARAEEIAMFEHRDLHEGNLCIKQTSDIREMDPESRNFFGCSGLDITILDYGLSRAEDMSIDYATPVALDLEKDLSLFTSTHASQCKVYRQMRSFMLRGDRECLPPDDHKTAYEKGANGPLSWDAYAPYTNVLWLAYLYEYMVNNFKGKEQDLTRFKKETLEMWAYLNPEADESVPCFGSAADVVGFGVEAGWVRQEQLVGTSSLLDKEESIILRREEDAVEESVRRSPRRRQR